MLAGHRVSRRPRAGVDDPDTQTDYVCDVHGRVKPCHRSGAPLGPIGHEMSCLHFPSPVHIRPLEITPSRDAFRTGDQAFGADNDRDVDHLAIHFE